MLTKEINEILIQTVASDIFSWLDQLTDLVVILFHRQSMVVRKKSRICGQSFTFYLNTPTMDNMNF